MRYTLNVDFLGTSMRENVQTKMRNMVMQQKKVLC